VRSQGWFPRLYCLHAWPGPAWPWLALAGADLLGASMQAVSPPHVAQPSSTGGAPTHHPPASVVYKLSCLARHTHDTLTGTPPCAHLPRTPSPTITPTNSLHLHHPPLHLRHHHHHALPRPTCTSQLPAAAPHSRLPLHLKETCWEAPRPSWGCSWASSCWSGTHPASCQPPG
jgi:hypothetical protein